MLRAITFAATGILVMGVGAYLSSMGSLSAQAAAPSEPAFVLSIVHGYSNRQLVLAYYPLPQPDRDTCLRTAEIELRSMAAVAHDASHFEGGTVERRGEGLVWESDAFSGTRFRAVARCRQASR